MLSQLQPSSGRNGTVILLASACCARNIIQIRNATCVFTCRGGPRTCGLGEVGCTLGACLPNRISSLKNSSLSMLVRYGAPCWSDCHDLGPAGRAMLSLLMLYCLSYGPVQSQPSLSACSVYARSHIQTDRHTYRHLHTHAHTRTCAVQHSVLLVSRPRLIALSVTFFSGACIITGPHVSSLGHMHHHWTTCIITGPHACCRPYAQACWTYGRRRMSGQAWGPLIFSGSMSHGL